MISKVFHNEKLKQITLADERYYTDDDINYVPSVTSILDVFPKGIGFQEWLKNVGGNASEILAKAGDKGSLIHHATEDLDNGIELMWVNPTTQKEDYSLEEWLMLVRYKEYLDTVKPILIANECSLLSYKLGYGGTIDRCVSINGENWLIDIKTGNAIYKTHFLQLSAYVCLWNEHNPNIPVSRAGILWLNANVKTSKVDFGKSIMQGESWQIKESDATLSEDYETFKHTKAIWHIQNPNPKPKNKIYPDRLSITK